MQATFQVHAAFPIKQRSRFVLVGEILEGSLQLNMHTELTVSGHCERMTIDSIEHVYKSDADGDVGLVFKYTTAEQLDRWMSAVVPEQVYLFSE